jgi:hypothetical protein
LKKKFEELQEEAADPQDWTALAVGQHVLVRAREGNLYMATIETKTRDSHEVWLICEGSWRTRHVVGHADGVFLEPIEKVLGPATPGRHGTDAPGVADG